MGLPSPILSSIKSEFLRVCNLNSCIIFLAQSFLSWWQPDNVTVACLSAMGVLKQGGGGRR